MYTDIFCPYCDKFSYALIANKEDFEENYLNNNQVYFEMRVTYMNYLSGHSNNSKPAGEATYCAAKQEKFWNYYDTLISTLYDDGTEVVSNYTDKSYAHKGVEIHPKDFAIFEP